MLKFNVGVIVTREIREQPMNNDVADQLQTSYDRLWRNFALLDAHEVETSRLAGGWTPKGLLAHIAFWDDYQWRRMEAARNGTSAQAGFPRPPLDNDERVVADEARPWEEVVAAADAARQALIAFARSLDGAAVAQEYPEGADTLSLSTLLAHMVRHTQLHTQELTAYVGSMQRWSRAALRAFLGHQHNNLMDGLSGLTEATLLATPVCGIWSIRDVLAHVLSWNEFEYIVLTGWPEVAPAKIEAWQGVDGIDAINRRLMAARADRNMIDICDGLMTHHRRILRAFDRASDAQLRTVSKYNGREESSLAAFFYRFALHEARHAEDIWHFRAGE